MTTMLVTVSAQPAEAKPKSYKDDCGFFVHKGCKPPKPWFHTGATLLGGFAGGSEDGAFTTIAINQVLVTGVALGLRGLVGVGTQGPYRDEAFGQYLFSSRRCRPTPFLQSQRWRTKHAHAFRWYLLRL